MKIKRREWEELNARVAKLEADLRQSKSGLLMPTRTGPILVNVIVPMILSHLKVESRHGYGWLLPLEADQSVSTVGTEP